MTYMVLNYKHDPTTKLVPICAVHTITRHEYLCFVATFVSLIATIYMMLMDKKLTIFNFLGLTELAFHTSIRNLWIRMNSKNR